MKRRTRRNPRPRAWSGRSGTRYSCPRAKHEGSPVKRAGRTYKVVGCAAPRRKHHADEGQYTLARGRQGGGKTHNVPKSAIRAAKYRTRLRNKGKLRLCPEWKTDVGFPHAPGAAKGCVYRRGGARGPKVRGASRPRRGEAFAWATRGRSRQAVEGAMEPMLQAERTSGEMMETRGNPLTIHRSRNFGRLLHHWHTAHNDPIYKLGSLFREGRSATTRQVEDAIHNLDRDLFYFQGSSQDRRELDFLNRDLVRSLNGEPELVAVTDRLLLRPTGNPSRRPRRR